MITPEIKKLIKENLYSADKITFKSDGTVEALRSFYYRMGKSAEDFEKDVKEELSKADIKIQVIKSGEEFRPFRGGAGIRKNSHWYVIFRVK